MQVILPSIVFSNLKAKERLYLQICVELSENDTLFFSNGFIVQRRNVTVCTAGAQVVDTKISKSRNIMIVRWQENARWWNFLSLSPSPIFLFFFLFLIFF